MPPLISDYAASLREIAAATQDEREIIARVGPLAREVALDHGVILSFLPKPIEEAGGSGLHITALQRGQRVRRRYVHE